MPETMPDAIRRAVRSGAAAVAAMPDFEAARGATVLITGAAGMIGSWLALAFLEADRLLGLNARIYGLSRDMSRASALYDGCALHSVSRNVISDLGDLPAFDYVIHAASPVGPALFANRPFEVTAANLAGTINLLRKAVKDGTRRFVFISTHEVYGAGKDLWSEDDAGALDFLSARACYPESKRAGENACVCAGNQYDLNVGIARLSRIYGPGMNLDSGLFICDFLKDVIAGRDIVVKGNGGLVRPLTHVADTASAVIKILFSGAPGSAYNVAPREHGTIAEIAEIVAAAAGRRVTFLSTPSAAGAVLQDAAKLRALGWQDRVSLREGLENLLKPYLTA